MNDNEQKWQLREKYSVGTYIQVLFCNVHVLLVIRYYSNSIAAITQSRGKNILTRQK